MADLASRPQRRHDLDWLKSLVILNVIFAHAAWLMVFVPGFSYINKDELTAKILWLYVAFMAQCAMPLLFAISGIATCFALRFRSAAEYIKERIKRLLVPLVFGVLVIFPPMFRYWPKPESFAARKFPYGLLRALLNGGLWMHLWFIFYLLAFSLVLLPLFLYLRRQSGRRVVSGLAAFFGRRWAIFLLGIPLAIVQATLTVKWPSGRIARHCIYNDVPRFLLYIISFIYGYLMASDEKFWQIIDRHVRQSLFLAVVCMLPSIVMRIRIGSALTPAYAPGYMLYSALEGFGTWFCVLALLGLGKKHLDFSNKLLDYAREASYPFYILHLTPMVIIGSYLVELRTPVIIEFFILSIPTFLATTAIYHLIIKRTIVTRFLFGMRWRKDHQPGKNFSGRTTK